jgi:hypothetical protein
LQTNGGSAEGQAEQVQQLGPVTPNLDPDFQNATAFQHLDFPQSNYTISQTNVLIEDRHFFNSFVQEGLLTGGTVQVTANESYLKENAPSRLYEPFGASDKWRSRFVNNSCRASESP